MNTSINLRTNSPSIAMMPCRYSRATREGGAILVTSLIILAVLTILGLSGITSGILEQRMAGNTRQAQIAFEASEAALQAGEAWLESAVNLTNAPQLETQFNGSQTGFYSERRPSPGVAAVPASGSFNIADTSAWANANSIEVPLANYDPGVTLANRPRYIIEYLGRTTVSAGNQSLANLDIILDPSKVAEDVREHAFRVTAIGWGMDGTSSRIVQSTVRRPLNP